MRVDSRTETSMTRHHLQGGVRRQMWSASADPHVNVVETKRRPNGGVDSSDAAKMSRRSYPRKTPRIAGFRGGLEGCLRPGRALAAAPAASPRGPFRS